jgi:predicted phage baseplate assembly protein
MRLPDVELDDRRFQDLVDEARLRIARRCPEWTDHNVANPGIVLTELFAWMTDMTIYRLNRLPDKLHVHLLELLGIELYPPLAASTDLRFRLAAPPAEPLRIPAGETEVGTRRTADEESTVFRTTQDVTIPPARPVAYAVERDGKVREVGVAHGVAEPPPAARQPFASPPRPGDALYLGFDSSLARLLVQIDVDCSEAGGAGIDPWDPPLRWEVSTAEGWVEAEVLDDQTGGFNHGAGAIELQLPPVHAAGVVGERRAYWLRCRVDERTRSGRPASYAAPPEVYRITAAPIGALVTAAHAEQVGEEALGESDGTPAQSFRLRYVPVLPAGPGETLEVLEPGERDWRAWERRESFRDSGPHDRHFRLDSSSGTVELGPSVRQADGGWRQHGAIPEKGALLRFTGYRHGGGPRGNVGAGKLTYLKRAIPGVASVTNPAPASGGVDSEPLDAARRRAALELRTRDRAVTAEDHVHLARAATRRVARAVCVPPGDGRPVRLHVVPRLEPAARRLSAEELRAGDDVLEEVAEFLDQRRLLGTTIEVLPARLRGVSVVADIEAAPGSDARRASNDVADALYAYLNPLVGGSLEGTGEGWPFGRTLNLGELYGVVHRVQAVESVRILRMYETNLDTGERASKALGSHVVIEPDEVIASGEHVIRGSEQGS